MKKYTTESTAGRARAQSYKSGPEPMGTNGPNSMPASVQKVDPSVRLGDLKGEINGNVPLAEQMRKPMAYQAKKGS